MMRELEAFVRGVVDRRIDEYSGRELRLKVREMVQQHVGVEVIVGLK